jgi:hypothetical protein
MIAFYERINKRYANYRIKRGIKNDFQDHGTSSEQAGQP